jgi:hypothetical protein
MRLPAAVTTPAVALVAATALAGCGASQATQVRDKVKQFARAVAARDYATICRDTLAPNLLADLAKGGIGCRQAMAIALGRVNSPHLVIGPVRVGGGTASVLTISQARGQKTVLTSLRLVRTSSGWRISALGSPVG